MLVGAYPFEDPSDRYVYCSSSVRFQKFRIPDNDSVVTVVRTQFKELCCRSTLQRIHVIVTVWERRLKRSKQHTGSIATDSMTGAGQTFRKL